MVALASSAGGDRAPKSAPVYNPGDLVRLLTASTASPFVITDVIHVRRLHGEYVRYVIVSGTIELSVDPANVVLIGEAATQAGAPIACEPESAAAEPEVKPAPAPKAEPGSMIEWHTEQNPNPCSVSADGRFEVSQTVKGKSQVVTSDRWTGERMIGDSLFASEEWCEKRLAGFPLMWMTGRSGWAAEFFDSRFTVRQLPDSTTFESVDCRFHVSDPLRRARFETLEIAKKWCEVRAVCRIDGSGAKTTLNYVGPPDSLQS
ncbi:unnamed protein product [Gemmata massiliana]|uniref:Uncharacterized protein n=1 Tax=Gemmata massiliana TaxID=1210884 RepID=A0A6P2D6C4_9BACT|nr:hypothetical protein [Gemmata massiliana]VTR96016.1 unnamed protein product [Gemmata massiliana]